MERRAGRNPDDFVSVQDRYGRAGIGISGGIFPTSLNHGMIYHLPFR